MPASTAPMIMPQDGPSSYHPQAFTDEELSEIFQIDFSEIFGSVDTGSKSSKYKGVQLPPTATSSAQKSSVTNRNKEEVASSRGKSINFQHDICLKKLVCD